MGYTKITCNFCYKIIKKDSPLVNSSDSQLSSYLLCDARSLRRVAASATCYSDRNSPLASSTHSAQPWSIEMKKLRMSLIEFYNYHLRMVLHMFWIDSIHYLVLIERSATLQQVRIHTSLKIPDKVKDDMALFGILRVSRGDLNQGEGVYKKKSMGACSRRFIALTVTSSREW